QGGDDGFAFLLRESIVLKYPADFRHFLFGDLFNLAILARLLLLVVLGIAASGKVSPQAHGNGSRGNFRQSADDDETRIRDGPRQSCCKRERNREAVRHSDDHVADEIAGGEMQFTMNDSPINVSPLDVTASVSGPAESRR